MQRHFFAGVNTPRGFYSFFKNIADDKECVRKIYLKGGPGMGKSTLMKRALERACEEGFSADVFHCSSDPDSLDGVYIPKLKAAILDATPPHNCDPEFPGVSGEIFNMAEFLDAEKVKENKSDIIHFTEHKTRAFEKTYNYLAAAKPVIDEISNMYKNSMYLHGIDLEAEKICSKVLPKITMPKSGRLRKLFLSAIGPDGFVNHTDSAFKGMDTITIKGGYGSDRLISKVMETALTRGFSVEAFYCPMMPGEKIEHIIISDINVALTTYNYYHHFSGERTVDLDEYIGTMPGRIDEAWSSVSPLLRRAMAAVSEAMAAHSFLEKFYSPAMDFDKLQIKSQLLIDSIF